VNEDLQSFKSKKQPKCALLVKGAWGTGRGVGSGFRDFFQPQWEILCSVGGRKGTRSGLRRGGWVMQPILTPFVMGFYQDGAMVAREVRWRSSVFFIKTRKGIRRKRKTGEVASRRGRTLVPWLERTKEVRYVREEGTSGIWGSGSKAGGLEGRYKTPSRPEHRFFNARPAGNGKNFRKHGKNSDLVPAETAARAITTIRLLFKSGRFDSA